MPQLAKRMIWDRLRVRDIWITPQNVRVPFWVAGGEHMQAALPRLAQSYMRYVVSMLFQGNDGAQAPADSVVRIEQLETDGLTYTMKWSNIVVEAGVFPNQIPRGAYDIENPVIAVAGGQNLYGTVSGNSINLTITYWDNEI